MKKIVFNEQKISDDEIDEIVTRVKNFIINDDNEIICAKSNGGIQLIGGHVEKGEKYIDTIKREIQEETGYIINENLIGQPFLEIKYYTSNYNNSGKNRISNILYYLIKTNVEPNKGNTNLTESEKAHNFNVQFIKFDKFEEYMHIQEKNENELHRTIAKEILIAFEELKKRLQYIRISDIKYIEK